MKRLLVIAATAATIAAATAGCGGAGRASVENGTAPASDSLRVGLVEWQIVTSSTAITAGVDHLTVTNAGTIVHNLYVSGGGVQAHTADLPPGRTATLTVTTRAGTTLTLTCEIPGHEGAGMHATVTVTR